MPIAAAAAAVAAARVPEHRAPRTAGLDLPGLALAAAAAVLLLGGLSGLANPGGLIFEIAAVSAGIGLLAGFLAQQRAADRRGGTPLVPLALQGRGTFRAATGVQLLFFIPVMGFSLVITQYLQTYLGYSPLAAGLLVLPWSVLVGVGAGLGSTALLPRWGRLVVTVGLLVMAAGIGAVAAVVTTVPAGPSWWQLLPGVAVGGLGMGLVVAPLTEIALREVPVDLASEASGIYNSVGQLSAALGFATLGAVFFALTATAGPGDRAFVTATTTALLAGSAIAVVAAAVTGALPRRLAAAPATRPGQPAPR
ncbi:MAG: MFS transporter [Actinobacteria bacterium]|nr:MFS transporter [Actinomycetota bacterium]